ncbi:universal stress protein [Streptomyces flavofungini]|uniref:Universal stress protein n=1 Tax=Streptomyces flavofungini TaxID=68200 RepID=A0ABS0XJ82_9ACTN|nr:universal stress protein [Streptomyces flavofungini]MBJ3812976.1 universal stress protein [Streptomyces flavofungini]GHC84243.1 stress-inducible protein [Streptomyces flavofungini]
MSRTVVAGFDGSPESRAAAEWAAREAGLLGAALKLVSVWQPVPLAYAPFLGGESAQHEMVRVPREAADGLRLRHRGVSVSVEQLSGRPSEVLAAVADDVDLLVLGSRGLSGLSGFLVGSVGQAVVAHTRRPVVLVRAGEQAADEHAHDPSGVPSAATPFRPVVLGLDAVSPDGSVIEFAFEAAARRDTALRVLHSWPLPPYFAYGLPEDPELNARLAEDDAAILAEALRSWRQKFPSVEVREESRPGKPVDHVVEASHDASLVVVGRRIRSSPVGARVGPVTHAVLHHAAAPVAVVPHD